MENLLTEQSGKDGLFLALAALPGWFFCMKSDVCMCGYMAHPPYPTWHIIITLYTLAALLSAGTLLLLSTMRLRYAVAGLVAGQLLPLSLWVFGPLLLLWLIVAAAIGLKASFRRTPRHGRTALLFTEMIWGMVGFVGLLMAVGLCL